MRIILISGARYGILLARAEDGLRKEAEKLTKQGEKKNSRAEIAEKKNDHKPTRIKEKVMLSITEHIRRHLLRDHSLLDSGVGRA